MIITNGIIEPGKRIGKYVLGSKKEDVITSCDNPLDIRERGGGGYIYTFENFKLWFNDEGLLDQVGVTKGFQDTFNTIGIGSTLEDVIRIFGSYKYESYDYLITGIDGICFELEDIDDWNELTAPIEWIFVFERC